MGLSLNPYMSNNLSQIVLELSETVGKLSSGTRISNAADYSASFAIGGLLRADIAGQKQSSRNVNDAISMVQTADAAAGSISDNLAQMKQLAVQAGSGTYSAKQKQLLQNQFNELASQVSQISNTATFNGIALNGGNIDVSIGAGQTVSIATQQVSVPALSLTSNPSAAEIAVDSLISQVSSYRGNLGAIANRLDSAHSVLQSTTENLMAARSRIVDIDVAGEIASMTANLVVANSMTSMQIHSRAISKTVLKLITG
jgi:flagellin